VTALCGGGTSAPKLGTDLALYYSAGRLAQLLVTAGVSELSAWLPLAGLIPVVASSFCGSDPPTMVALSQAESDALANNTFGTDFVNGLGKFKDVLLNLIWNDICHCTSGTYTPSTVPSIDVNTPVFQAPTPQPNSPCHDSGVQTIAAVSGSTGPFPINDFFQGRPVTSLSFDVTSSINVSPGASTVLHVAQINLNPSFTVLSNTAYTVGPTGHQTIIEQVNPLCGEVQIFGGTPTGGGTSLWTYQYTTWCGSTPGGTQQPCCPPDAATQAYLDLIFKQVTLLQRQLAPFGYVAKGSPHTGLSGAGNFDVSGLLGVSVSLTTLPSSYGREGTSPEELFGLGWLTFGTPDGYPSGFRIERNDQLILPPRCSAFTNIAYDLAPGVVLDIQELEREP